MAIGNMQNERFQLHETTYSAMQVSLLLFILQVCVLIYIWYKALITSFSVVNVYLL